MSRHSCPSSAESYGMLRSSKTRAGRVMRTNASSSAWRQRKPGGKTSASSLGGAPTDEPSPARIEGAHPALERRWSSASPADTADSRPRATALGDPPAGARTRSCVAWAVWLSGLLSRLVICGAGSMCAGAAEGVSFSPALFVASSRLSVALPAPAAIAGRRWRLTLTHVPLPSPSEERRMEEPLCRDRISRVMVRPSPVPPLPWSCPLPTWLKTSPLRRTSISSRAMPTPSSLTTMRTSWRESAASAPRASSAGPSPDARGAETAVLEWRGMSSTLRATV
mmetsp:Transcript_22061/g.68728  ORF Transcript_22061/g.68728 Transcript_22061/m.68728 type:complete len:281 (-) Transcript_22061:1350-2192(-)